VIGWERMHYCEAIGGHSMQCCGEVIGGAWMGFEF